MLIKFSSSLLVEQDDTLGRVQTKASLRHSVISHMRCTQSSHVLVKLMRGHSGLDTRVCHILNESIDNDTLFVPTLKVQLTCLAVYFEGKDNTYIKTILELYGQINTTYLFSIHEVTAIYFSWVLNNCARERTSNDA